MIQAFDNRTRSLLLACVAALSIGSGPAAAHSMYQSAVLLDFVKNTVHAELQLPIDRLSLSFRQNVDAEHFPSECAQLAAYVLAHVHPVTEDGKPIGVRLDSMQIQPIENAPYLVVHLVFAPPTGAQVDTFTLNYDVITHEIVTHVVLVSIRSDSAARIPPNDPFLLGILRGKHKSLVVDRRSIL